MLSIGTDCRSPQVRRHRTQKGQYRHHGSTEQLILTRLYWLMEALALWGTDWPCFAIQPGRPSVGAFAQQFQSLWVSKSSDILFQMPLMHCVSHATQSKSPTCLSA